ncbi:MAG: hypothetical protein WAT25_07660 [Paracoccaceae bacterium]
MPSWDETLQRGWSLRYRNVPALIIAVISAGWPVLRWQVVQWQMQPLRKNTSA